MEQFLRTLVGKPQDFTSESLEIIILKKMLNVITERFIKENYREKIWKNK